MNEQRMIRHLFKLQGYTEEPNIACNELYFNRGNVKVALKSSSDRFNVRIEGNMSVSRWSGSWDQVIDYLRRVL